MSRFTDEGRTCTGVPGAGWHIAVAFAVPACRAGYSIYFTSLDDMVRNLKASEAAGRLTLASNKTFSEWGQVFGDEVLATAILDRLFHRCEATSITVRATG